MSLATVLEWLAIHAPDARVIEAHASTATVADAALALGVEPGRIAKTLALRVGDRALLVVARGDARLDNVKCKAVFGGRPRMLDREHTEELTGHPVGGVCPFALPSPVPIYCDVSLRAFPTVYPAAGSRNSSVEMTPDELARATGAKWIDACSEPPAS
jgi:prolyl-tRNA editing enzyme YbaK/EbsC (Cys-tRNA(Pro) deacylase)